jgi:hypothetical protein
MEWVTTPSRCMGRALHPTHRLHRVDVITTPAVASSFFILPTSYILSTPLTTSHSISSSSLSSTPVCHGVPEHFFVLLLTLLLTLIASGLRPALPAVGCVPDCCGSHTRRLPSARPVGSGVVG